MTEKFAKPAVSTIIEKIVDGKKYILIQERFKENGDTENGMIEIPGGKIREYENVFDALRREVKEETGLVVVKIHGEEFYSEEIVNGNRTISFTPFTIIQNLTGAYSLIVNVFVCEAEGELLIETNESRNIRWESVEKVREMINENHNKFFLTDVTALKKYLKSN